VFAFKNTFDIYVLTVKTAAQIIVNPVLIVLRYGGDYTLWLFIAIIN
jgi:hypothetical protein